ncbi:hypothetical protein [Kitasatospora sp. NPDC051914]|uniref:hypothetical protein n=1 Tax=Kitasatospora sp. NPDC051914 TaxID=3154945 RepID=UPI00343BE033
MHRTVPLSQDGATRTMLVVSLAGDRDLGKELLGDDRWWEHPHATAVQQVGRTEPDWL